MNVTIRHERPACTSLVARCHACELAVYGRQAAISAFVVLAARPSGSPTLSQLAEARITHQICMARSFEELPLLRLADAAVTRALPLSGPACL